MDNSQSSRNFDADTDDARRGRRSLRGVMSSSFLAAAAARAADALRASQQCTRLVVGFHGLGGSSATLRPLTMKWKEALPRTSFVLLDADFDESGRRNWFPFTIPPDATESERVTVILGALQAAMAHADAKIDDALATAGLSSRELVLMGFSQGAAMSAYTGLRRRCLGVMPMGGPCPPREQLLPDHQETRVCVISGDCDRYAPHDHIREAFAKYAKVEPGDGVHIIEGLEHRVQSEHATIGLAFLRSCGCE